ncbi:unannotated protein [freshwater metagenome]|uniref:Unannotated protein n=1 Tax=freshwater metagenome TaxID=449393 RepID=A0A6J6JZV0_9ZZZZ
MRAPLNPAPVTADMVRRVRDVIEGLGPDRFLAPELEAVEVLLRG